MKFDEEEACDNILGKMSDFFIGLKISSKVILKRINPVDCSKYNIFTFVACLLYYMSSERKDYNCDGDWGKHKVTHRGWV